MDVRFIAYNKNPDNMATCTTQHTAHSSTPPAVHSPVHRGTVRWVCPNAWQENSKGLLWVALQPRQRPLHGREVAVGRVVPKLAARTGQERVVARLRTQARCQRNAGAQRDVHGRYQGCMCASVLFHPSTLRTFALTSPNGNEFGPTVCPFCTHQSTPTRLHAVQRRVTRACTQCAARTSAHKLLSPCEPDPRCPPSRCTST